MSSASTVRPADAPRRRSAPGWALTLLCTFMLAASAFMKLFAPAAVRATAAQSFGFPEAALPWLALLEVTCTLLYVLPRTAFAGAVLLTGYLGGAVATHARLGEPAMLFPVVLGGLAWLGLYLRDPRLRLLLKRAGD